MMSFYYPLPTEERIQQPFEETGVPCPSCGHDAVRRYTALRSNGWHVVERCRDCFAYVSVERTAQSFVPLTAGWKASSAG